MSAGLCGHAVIDYSLSDDGEFDGPCERPATSWRWYQDVEHEDVLLPACDIHENRGGIRMHAAEVAADMFDRWFRNEISAYELPDYGDMQAAVEAWRAQR